MLNECEGWKHNEITVSRTYCSLHRSKSEADDFFGSHYNDFVGNKERTFVFVRDKRILLTSFC